MRERTEVIDGREFTVVVLPRDRRLQPAEVRKRALWNRLTAAQKKEHIERRKRAAAKRKRRRQKVAT